MSEPLSTDDIEDVVSSVRRLVSPEARPRPVSRDLGQDRLLLTPALRVVTDTDTAPSVAPAAPLILTDRAPDPVAEGDAAGLGLQVQEGEWEDAFWSDAEPALAELALGVEEAELVLSEAAPVAAADAAAETAPWAQDADDWVDDDPIPFVPPQRAAAPHTEAGTEAAMPPASDPPPDAPSAEAGAAASGLAANDMAQVLTDQDGNPVTVLDEDSLSQIVRILIREELQGVLGERITHNVRKLVRAEINRALAAQALD